MKSILAFLSLIAPGAVSFSTWHQTGLGTKSKTGLLLMSSSASESVPSLTTAQSDFNTHEMMTRRNMIKNGAGTFALASAVLFSNPLRSLAAPVVPVVKSNMGGQLEPFKDLNKGYRMLKPSGWNQFDSVPGEYDMKWIDLVERTEMVVINYNPVKSTTALADLGTAQEVGEKLAAKRGSKLVSASERKTEGIYFYDFEFEGPQVAELYSLSVSRSRLWSVLCTAKPGAKMNRRKELYNNIVGSFVPKI